MTAPLAIPITYAEAHAEAQPRFASNLWDEYARSAVAISEAGCRHHNHAVRTRAERLEASRKALREHVRGA